MLAQGNDDTDYAPRWLIAFTFLFIVGLGILAALQNRARHQKTIEKENDILRKQVAELECKKADAANVEENGTKPIRTVTKKVMGGKCRAAVHSHSY
jgi:hypothetical protein